MVETEERATDDLEGITGASVGRRSACSATTSFRVNRPLLFLDVDGPLNPYAAKPERRPDGYTTLRVPRSDAHEDDRGLSSRRRPLRVWLNPD